MRRRLVGLVCGVLALAGTARAQEPAQPGYSRDTLIAAARQVMEAARFAALITLDVHGQPQARTVDPFVPGDDMVVWIGTNRRTRKVGQIRRDPRVTLYYFDREASAYVTLVGTGKIVDDPDSAARYWKPEWEAFYPDRQADYVLIAVTPRRLEILDYTRGIVGDPRTWTPPSVEFQTDR